MLSYTEENYLKSLLKISSDNEIQTVGTNELAARLSVKPATANNMLKKLKQKKQLHKLILTENYQKQIG